MSSDAPSYDEWVAYCFEQGYADFHSHTDESYYRAEPFLELDRTILHQYLTRLFREPSCLPQDFTREQLADGIWFIFGVGSLYAGLGMEGTLPLYSVVDFYSATGDLYVKLFDRLCCRNASDPRGDHSGTDPLDKAVFMIWDMGGGIDLGIIFPDGRSEIVDSGFQLLDRILEECRTSTCQLSALHGLGHLRMYYPDRVRESIDRFLASADPPDHVAEYASRAREGPVQ